MWLTRECILLLQFANGETRELQDDLQDIENLRKDLAAYYCEDEATFKLEECIRIFSTFFDKFKKAIQVGYTPVAPFTNMDQF